MNIEGQVCSLELSKRLKELNVKQESLYAYVLSEFGTINNESYENRIILTHSEISNSPNKWSAFTSSELGEMLPNYVLSSDPEPFNGFRIYIEKFISVEGNNKINNWIINYHCDTVEVHGKQEFFVKKLTNNIYDPNLANAMAKMLIYLLENGMIDNPAILPKK